MQQIHFHLAAKYVTFDVEGQYFNFEMGLAQLISRCVKHQFDALAIEYLIYEIEEILEQLKLEYQFERIAHTDDAWMRQLAAVFFEHAITIDRHMLEHGFNELIEHTEFYRTQLGQQAVYILTYFVFVREMMHHLNIQQIQLEHEKYKEM